MAGGSTKFRCDWYLAVFVGTDELGYEQDPNAGRVECRMWDMLRYDRCYPASNAERFREMGFILLKQPYVKDTKGGFTTGRWESFGFRTLISGPANASGAVSVEMEERCRQHAERIALRKKEQVRGNHAR